MPKSRVVNVKAFMDQVAEAVVGPDQLVELKVNNEDSIWMRLGVPGLVEPDDPIVDDLRAAADLAQETDDPTPTALVILGSNPKGRTAEEQLKVWTDAGYTAAQLLLMWNKENDAAQERLGNFRYRPSSN